MTEPSSVVAVAAVTTAGAVAIFPGVDAATVLGAFAGAAVFVLNQADLSIPRRALYLFVSLAGGIVAGEDVAGIMTKLLRWALPDGAHINHAVGAMLSAALIVSVLQWAMRQAATAPALRWPVAGSDKGEDK